MEVPTNEALTAVIAVATAVTTVFGHRKFNQWKYARDGRDRRKNGSNGGCVLARGAMPDSAIPGASLEYYSETRAFQKANLEKLHEIAECLREGSRINRTMYRVLVAVGRGAGLKLEGIPDEPGDL